MIHAQSAQPRKNTPAFNYRQMLETVRYDGAYPTRERADQAVHTVLEALGRQLGGELRSELAARLPAQAARHLLCRTSDPQPLTGRDFVHDIALRTGVTPAVARWDTGTVLRTVATLAGRDLLARTLAELPPGYALLFGCAELTPQAA